MKRALVFFAHLTLALYVYWIWLKDPGLECNWTAPVSGMLHGTAQKPYVYRTLIPSLARGLASLFSPATRAALGRWAHSGLVVEHCFADFKWQAGNALEYLVVALICFPFLLGFVWALRALFRTLYDAPPYAVDLFSLMALAGVQLFFVYCNYLYDLPTLFFFTLALLLMARRQFGAYLTLFAISLFNKETTILLAVVFAVHFFDSLDRRRYARLLAAQLVLFFASRRLLAHWYSGNGGVFSWNHIYDHNLTFAFVRWAPGTLAAALLLVVVVAGHWSQKPLLARRALLVILPPLVGAAFVWGYFDELRDYYEAYPPLLLLAAPTVARWMGVRCAPRTAVAG